MPTKLSIIFVPGAWHGAPHVQPITPYLEQQGHRVVPVKLWTSSVHDKTPTVEDNIAIIRKVIQSEVDAGYNICVIGHSVSGQSCAPAVSDFLATASTAQKSQLLQVIFIACFFENMRLDAEVNWYKMNWENMTVQVDDFAGTFYNDIPAAQAQPFVDALDAHQPHMPPETQSDLWRTQVPTTYFVCLKDQAVPLHLQRLEAKENGMPTVDVDMDHCPFVTRPREFAEELCKVLIAEKSTQ